MVNSAEREGSSVAPFLKKCYEMVDDEATDPIISWGRNNDTFVISDMTQFSVHLLPKYFKHSNFSSFMRQLNIYGFRKVDTDNWEFASDGFLRGQKHLLKNICRRKNTQGSEQRKTLQHQDSHDEKVEENENLGLWKEVENLKTDKSALMQELIKLRQHQETVENTLLILRDRLQGMENNQQQMLSFLVMAVQNPVFLVQLVQPKESNWHVADFGNMLEQVTEDDNQIPSDAVIVRYQPPKDDLPTPLLSPTPGSGVQQESDPLPDGLKDYFLNSDFLKSLMDEKLSPLENHGPFFLPDMHDDIAWQQLLLASPLSGKVQNRKEEGEGPGDSEMEISTSDCQEDISGSLQFSIEQLETSDNFDMELAVGGGYMENPKTVQLITEQMELLASESNSNITRNRKMNTHK